MKVLHLNQSDIQGGAARAAYRIHHAVLDAGVHSTMLADVTVAGDWTVEGPIGKWNKALGLFRPHINGLMRKALQTRNPIMHSPELLPSSWVRRVNESDADIVHLHWVQGAMLSVADIGRITKPMVWTLHDMWAFCGAEHYTMEFRWREGYLPHNRPEYEFGFDLNRWTWQRKRRNWRQAMHIVTPSAWLRDCVKESALMHNWPVTLIPYPIDVSSWCPIERQEARGLLGLPLDKPLLLFGALSEAYDPRKGLDLLLKSLEHLRGEDLGIELVIFGQLAPKKNLELGFPVHYAGRLHDDISLRLLYSAADVLAIPSRQDNLPLTCMESLSCGTPVVAFDTSGLPSMIDHHKTGYLAKSFDTVDFANGIRWILGRSGERSLKLSARRYAEDHFNPARIAKQYVDLYQSILSI